MSFAGITIAALIRLLDIQRLRPVARMAEVLTVSALVLAAMSTIADLGQPVRGVINLFRYARPQSPFYGTFTLVLSGYLFASLIYLYLDGRRDAARLARVDSRLRWFHRRWAAGYADTAAERDRHRRSSFWLSLAIIPLLVTAAVQLAGAAARARAFAGSRPEHAKMTFPTQTSRRALLTFSLPEYLAAPAIDHGRCAADRGCHACVDVCPQRALSITGGRVSYDRNACEPCGRCVTACPTGATENPAATTAQLEAQVAALLDPAAGPPGPRGIVFVCRRATSAPPAAAGWYPVTLPCTGMLRPAWLLAPLAMGAAAVAARPCGESGCPLAGDADLRKRVGWCQEFLAAAGASTAR